MNPLALSLFVAALLGGPALAEPKADDHSAHLAAGTVADTATLTDGEVRKVDAHAGRLTLRHGAIRNLDMPGMTMVFQVRDPGLLSKVKVGDLVRFRAERSGGAFLVTAIEVAK